MQTFVIDYVLRTSLIAAAVAAVLWMMRVRAAGARHAVWVGVAAVMMVLPAWMAWGPKARVPVLPPAARTAAAATAVMPIVDVPIAAARKAHPAAVAPRRSPWDWTSLFAGIYFIGAFALLMRLAVGTVRARRLAGASCVVPVTVGFFRPRIILPESAGAWPRARLDAVMVHEGEHARRRDPLFQWVALLNRALFWFHPLAWWLERKVSGLAEEACDEAVIARGHDAREYAQVLLDLARMVERSGGRMGAMGMAMPGVFLPRRIRRMLSGVPAPRISRMRMSCAAAVCAAAAAMVGTGTLVRAQSNAGSKGQPGPAFEVVSVKPIDAAGGGKSKDGGGRGGGGVPPGLDHKRFSFPSTASGLIVKAYGVNGCGLLGEKENCPEMTGAPAWLTRDPFEVQAKLPEDAPDYTFRQFLDGQAPQLQLMLRAMLADRFNLKVHRETKELPVYVLTVGRGGPKFKAATGEMIKLRDGSMGKDRSMGWTFANGKIDDLMRRMIVKNRSIQEWTDALSNVMDRPVVNRTGLTGEFDMTMQYERDVDPNDAADGVPRLGQNFGATFFTAVQEQLGLKLEATKGPVEILVIDHVERPSPN